MDLKQILGEELYNQLLTACKGKGKDGKDIELAVVNDGSYIPKAKFDEANNDKKAYKEQIDNLTTQLTDLKKLAGDNEALKTQIGDLQKAVEDGKTKLKETKINSAIQVGLTSAKIKKQYANILTGQIDKTKLTVDDDGNITAGIDEQIKLLKDSFPESFETDVPGGSGNNPGAGGNAHIYTKAEISAMSQAQINADWANISNQMGQGLIK